MIKQKGVKRIGRAILVLFLGIVHLHLVERVVPAAAHRSIFPLLIISIIQIFSFVSLVIAAHFRISLIVFSKFV